jgi:integrase
VKSKRDAYRLYLNDAFGAMRLDHIDAGAIARFRASLVKAGLGEKRINNILAVLSKPLHYAVDAEVIARAPKVGLFKVERPEVTCWELPEYARILEAARSEGAEWYAAVCLAGEAGLRIGEVKAARWHEDIDLVANTITVNQQTRQGTTGTPNGRTRRTVPMTATLSSALRALQMVRRGLAIRNLDGSAKTDGQADAAIYRICRHAGLPERGWHTLRHCFGTHAALFGVNPWTLMTWMGHKRIDETMLYVHVAAHHRRDIPKRVVEAGQAEGNPDCRILAMLGARGKCLPNEGEEVREAEAI